MGTACHVRGSDQLLTRVGEVLRVQPGETDREQKFTLKTVNCLGCCAMGPVMTVGEDYYSNPSVEELKRITSRYE
jgi:NADH-quinone oxidoreductase subunit E